MRILAINPNATEAMTQAILTAARAAAGAGVTVEGHTCVGAPPAIEGPEDGEAAAPHVAAAAARAREQGFDAVIVGCFDDTGLDAARAAFGGPTLGIGQAAFHAAALLGGRFSVVTTLAVSVPVIEDNLRACGLAVCCARVRASGVAVLALESDPAAPGRVADEIARAVAQDGVGTVVLGCAGMAMLRDSLASPGGPRLIDGVRAAVALAEALHRTLRPDRAP